MAQVRVTLEIYDRELRRNCTKPKIDFIGDLQNLAKVHQKFDAKTLSDVSGPHVFSIEADTLSIWEVGEKLTALNEENFQGFNYTRRGTFS